MSKSIVEPKGLEFSAKDNAQYQDQVYRLKAHISKLTGHAYECEIQVDPEWKPCTCGRG